MELSARNGYPNPEPLPVNVAIIAGKVREFDVVWKVVVLCLIIVVHVTAYSSLISASCLAVITVILCVELDQNELWS